MKDPVRLINRSGLTSTLLRAGSDERPSSGQVRRAAAALGTAAAIGVATGEAAGGGATVVATGAASATLAKVGGGSVSVLLAAKWAGIGSVGAMLFLGATELGSRAISGATSPPPAQVTLHSNAPPPVASGKSSHAPSHVDEPAREGTDLPREEIAEISAPERREAAAPSATEALADAPRREGERRVRDAVRSSSVTALPVTGTLLPPPPRVDPLPSAHGDLPANAPLAAVTPAAPHQSSAAPSLEGAEPAAEGAGVARKSEARAEATLRLTQEVNLVNSAWGAVKRNEFARALATLADYERQFPELGLHLEVLFVRMEAEDRSGRAADARFQASRIVALYPKSAQAGRARALLGRH